MDYFNEHKSGRINQIPASKPKRKVKKHIPGARRREVIPRFEGKISQIEYRNVHFPVSGEKYEI